MVELIRHVTAASDARQGNATLLGAGVVDVLANSVVRATPSGRSTRAKVVGAAAALVFVIEAIRVAAAGAADSDAIIIRVTIQIATVFVVAGVCRGFAAASHNR